MLRALLRCVLRLLLWLLTHTVYRMRVDGRENIPEKGGALLVCNHLSALDALLLQASTHRPIRFLMFQGRFSKIGGEMVPHIAIEEKLHELIDGTEQAFVVTSVPDEKRGERLIVLHRLSEARIAACLQRLVASDLPNLWKPKFDAFHRVERFPLLGTGKLDLRRVKELAVQLSVQQP